METARVLCLVLSAVLCTVHGEDQTVYKDLTARIDTDQTVYEALTARIDADQTGYERLIARIDRLEGRVDFLDRQVSTLETNEANQQRLISEQQATIERQRAAMSDAVVRTTKTNRILRNRVHHLEKIIAANTKVAAQSSKPRKQDKSSQGISHGTDKGRPSFSQVLGRRTWVGNSPVGPLHSAVTDNSKRLLLPPTGDDGPVAFMARMDSSYTKIGINQSFVFETELMNIGNGYHNLHGVFIAPKAGIYIFSSSLLSSRSDEHLEAEMLHNGVLVCRIYAHDGTVRWEQSSNTALIQVQQGDEVWVRNRGANIDVYGGGYATFSGYLLWPM